MIAPSGTNGAPEKGAWEEAFLAELRVTGNVSEAARRSRVPRRTAYNHRGSDEAFAAEWDDALEEACDALELEARRRAEECSDTLMIFLLKAHRPEKYRERRDVKVDMTTRPLGELTEAAEKEGPPDFFRHAITATEEEA